MLRLVVLLLVLANLALWSWSQWGGGDAATGSEGEGARRLARQLRPESIRVLGAAAGAGETAAAAQAPSAQTAAPATATGGAAGEAGMPPSIQQGSPQAALSAGALCVEAGPFAPDRVAAAERELGVLTPGSWRRERVELASGYAITLGRFDSPAAAEAARADWVRRHTDVLPIRSGDTRSTLQLGHFATLPAAQAVLAGLVERGLAASAAAQVAAVGARTEVWLRVESPTPAQLNQLAALPSAALAGGFRPCAPR